MDSAERRIILYTNLGHALVHGVEATYGALLIRIQLDLGGSDAFMGAVASVFGWAFGATALPSGFLSDRLGPHRVLALTFALATIASVLVALSGTPWMLATSMGLLGLAVGLYHPAGTTLIAHGVQRRGLGMGYHGVAGNLGMAIAPAVAGGLAVLADWRAAYLMLAALAALLTVWATRVASGVTASPSRQEDVSSVRPRFSRGLLVGLVMVYLVSVLTGLVYRGSLTFLPSHIHDRVSENLSESLTTLALLTGAAGQYVGGLLTQRMGLERLAVLVTGLAVPPLALMGIVTGMPLVALAAVFIFFNFAGQPVFNTLIAEYTPWRFVGRSFGLSYLAGFGIGGTGGVIAGVLVERWDTGVAFLGMAAIWLLALLAALVLPFLTVREPLPMARDRQPA